MKLQDVDLSFQFGDAAFFIHFWYAPGSSNYLASLDITKRLVYKPSLAANAAIPTLRSSSSKLPTETCSFPYISSHEKMDSTFGIHSPYHSYYIRSRQEILCFLSYTNQPNTYACSHCCCRLQNQFPPKSSSCTLNICPTFSQRRTAFSSASDKWRPLPQDWPGNRHAVGDTANRISEDVLKDVRCNYNLQLQYYLHSRNDLTM